ncbi:hypothetical protein [Pyrodictium abyssi]|uniref:Uncharacterized protein n=1 Tax=Pyrodictium abyssi TaxID=54256 RepID=A0ABM8IW07_9CREN|nr:hypothetical protein PABY_13100 [Pyrodictium abyssi]
MGGDGRVRVYRDTALVQLDSPVAGEYQDYTYGLLVEGLHGSSPELIRLGLATLCVYLRRAHGVPLGLLKYSVYALGEKRLIEIHEEAAAGLLVQLDWAQVSRGLQGYRPGDLDEILLLELDEYAYQALESLGFDWQRAAAEAARIADTLAGRQRVEVALAGRRIRVSKP